MINAHYLPAPLAQLSESEPTHIPQERTTLPRSPLAQFHHEPPGFLPGCSKCGRYYQYCLHSRYCNEYQVNCHLHCRIETCDYEDVNTLHQQCMYMLTLYSATSARAGLIVLLTGTRKWSTSNIVTLSVTTMLLRARLHNEVD